MNKILLIFCAIILVACSSSKVKVAVKSSEQLNQDANHRSLPVVARVYQLKNTQQFNAANFNLLWKNDHKALGSDLLSKEEFVIRPGEKKTITINRQEDAEYVAILGLFRDYKKGEWRVVSPVKRKVKIKLEDSQLSLGS